MSNVKIIRKILGKHRTSFMTKYINFKRLPPDLQKVAQWHAQVNYIKFNIYADWPFPPEHIAHRKFIVET